MNTENDSPYPFRWDKISLHGIGSYYNGAEIDIRPITVLCGTNGSGKSTWLNIVKLIKECISPDIKNFSELKEKIKINSGNAIYTNARIHNVEQLDMSSDDKFGSIGTIGFYFKTIHDYRQNQCPRIDSILDNLDAPLLSTFLNDGFISKNTDIKIYLTIPDIFLGYDIIGLTNGYEVTIGNETLKYTYNHPENKPFHSNHQISISQKVLNIKDADYAILLGNSFKRFVCMLDDLLGGLFSIGSIRDICKENEEYFIENIQTRYVGENGQNTHVLVNKYCWNPMKSENNKYVFGGYYTTWLRKLIEVWYVADRTIDGLDIADRLSLPEYPSDFLHEYEPALFNPKNLNDSDPPHEDPHGDDKYFKRYNANILWGEGLGGFGPSNFSTGFHQIAPMIVQSGLMKPSEICAIENPEVHLHPDLQLKLTEFFLRQAKAGRYFILETHSDLLIRRIIREMLEEEICIGQENIRIYFTSVYKPPESNNFCYSQIQRLEVDENGRINNWPAGFLDTSVNESKRLLDIMYGKQKDE